MPAKTDLELGWTGDPEADAMISRDPNALLIGFCLDQQFLVERAFLGPKLIQERLGTIDPQALAKVPLEKMRAAFAQPPAVHRYWASMAERVQALCRVLSSKYNGKAEKIWTEAADAYDLEKRFRALPGFGELKAKVMCGVVTKHFGIKLKGWEDVIPQHPTLADVRTTEERIAYQQQKRAHKAAIRAANGATPERRS